MIGPKVEYIDTPFGPHWREWYTYIPPSAMMFAQWRRDRTGRVWYAMYRQ